MKTIVVVTLFVCLLIFVPMTTRLLALGLFTLVCVLFPWIGLALVLFGLCIGLLVVLLARHT